MPADGILHWINGVPYKVGFARNLFCSKLANTCILIMRSHHGCCVAVAYGAARLYPDRRVMADIGEWRFLVMNSQKWKQRSLEAQLSSAYL